MEKEVGILGSTGSIGTQSLDVCRTRGYRVGVLTAHKNIKKLEEQAREFLPRLVVVSEESGYADLKRALADLPTQVRAGSAAMLEAAAHPRVDTVINAVVGIAGLRPTLSAIEAGKAIALANKETIIVGGTLIADAMKKHGARIVPVDSEHSAILQCLEAGRRDQVRGIILTASGGPFFGRTRQELRGVTVEEALRHPNWSMGAKITVDSATLMNKGLEFIEAMWFFELRPPEIEIVVHRQSILHSAVEFKDGSVIAQLGVPDMHCAIQYAITYPDHMPISGKRLCLADYGSLTFERPDFETFDCLRVCLAAAQQGGLAPCVANGANEAAVELFLSGRIGFLRIGELVEAAVERVKTGDAATLQGIEEADRAAREYVKSNV